MCSIFMKDFIINLLVFMQPFMFIIECLVGIVWHKFFSVSVKQFWNYFEFVSLFVTNEGTFILTLLKREWRFITYKKSRCNTIIQLNLNLVEEIPTKHSLDEINIISWKIFSSLWGSQTNLCKNFDFWQQSTHEVVWDSFWFCAVLGTWDVRRQ